MLYETRGSNLCPVRLVYTNLGTLASGRFPSPKVITGFALVRVHWPLKRKELLAFARPWAPLKTAQSLVHRQLQPQLQLTQYIKSPIGSLISNKQTTKPPLLVLERVHAYPPSGIFKQNSLHRCRAINEEPSVFFPAQLRT